MYEANEKYTFKSDLVKKSEQSTAFSWKYTEINTKVPYKATINLLYIATIKHKEIGQQLLVFVYKQDKTYAKHAEKTDAFLQNTWYRLK